MGTIEYVKDHNNFINSHPEYVEKIGGLLFSPTINIEGYTFEEYDNGKCYSRFPWINYFRILSPSRQELRCADYGTWVRRIYNFLVKKCLIQ